MSRYCLKQDGDCHWYLVPLEEKEAFERILEEATESDIYDVFETEFSHMRIDGPHALTFSDPIEEI